MIDEYHYKGPCFSMAVHAKFVMTNVSVAVLPLLQLFTINYHSTTKIVVL